MAGAHEKYAHVTGDCSPDTRRRTSCSGSRCGIRAISPRRDRASTAAVAAAPAFVEREVAAAKVAQADGDVAGAIDLCTEGLALTATPLPALSRAGACTARRSRRAARRRCFRDGARHRSGRRARRITTMASRCRCCAADARGRVALPARAGVRPDLVAAEFNLGVAVPGGRRNRMRRSPPIERARARPDGTLPRTRTWARCCSPPGASTRGSRISDALRGALPDSAAARRAGARSAASTWRLRGARSLSRGTAPRADSSARNEHELVRLPGAAPLSAAFLRRRAGDCCCASRRRTTARRRSVYGAPLARQPARRPGRIRVGYLSADLRNHVMGKMMWQAIAHHDRARFELLLLFDCRASATSGRERFESVGDRFVVDRALDDDASGRGASPTTISTCSSICRRTQGRAAGHPRAQAGARAAHARRERGHRRAVADRLQADRSLRRRGGKPGVPDRDAAADGGCVYPFRHVAPATEHPFHRAALRHCRRRDRHRRVRHAAQAVAALPAAVA